MTMDQNTQQLADSIGVLFADTSVPPEVTKVRLEELAEVIDDYLGAIDTIDATVIDCGEEYD